MVHKFEYDNLVFEEGSLTRNYYIPVGENQNLRLSVKERSVLCNDIPVMFHGPFNVLCIKHAYTYSVKGGYCINGPGNKTKPHSLSEIKNRWRSKYKQPMFFVKSVYNFRKFK